MIRTDLDQRIEEIGLALSETFESERSPIVRRYDAGQTYFLQLSWGVKSSGDTTLDSRCVATLRFSQSQIFRYADSGTARRIELRSRLQQLLRERTENVRPLPTEGECAIDIPGPDELF